MENIITEERAGGAQSQLATSPTRWWYLLAVASVLLAVVYVGAVLTPAGQSFENAALRGADQIDQVEFNEASRALEQITLWSLGVTTLAVGAIGLFRRSLSLAAIAMGIIFVGQVITQALKRFILPRPELVEVTGDYAGNSFPSGHTTIAMTVLIALFLVVPYKWRGLAMLLVSPWAFGIGAYTITAKWHRLSDTIGADLVALIVGALASLLLLRLGYIERDDSRPRPRLIFVWGAAIAAVILLIMGCILASVSWRYSVNLPIVEWDLFLSAHSLSLAGSIFALLAFWWTWRGISVRI
ncbi:MAG: phosphatase PAP2 family protein [Leucobacter sp.]|nr:phosphatase PAP2 family protein [Leucobacter sp.]